ncbi:MAG TPA: hypothetical protein VHU87_01770 [Rhizomicrobium sp.]|nr:hypothetical protein [Rhizomicrobium sp.]
MSRAAPFLLALVLSAAPALGQSDTELQIEARRLGAMVDQSDAALHLLSSTWPLGQSVGDENGDAFAVLIAAVRRYDAMMLQACRAKLVGPELCAAPYDPPWLKAKPPTPAAARAAVNEAGARITPFWSAVCTRAKKATGDTSLCAME